MPRRSDSGADVLLSRVRSTRPSAAVVAAPEAACETVVASIGVVPLDLRKGTPTFEYEGESPGGRWWFTHAENGRRFPCEKSAKGKTVARAISNAYTNYGVRTNGLYQAVRITPIHVL